MSWFTQFNPREANMKKEALKRPLRAKPSFFMVLWCVVESFAPVKRKDLVNLARDLKHEFSLQMVVIVMEIPYKSGKSELKWNIIPFGQKRWDSFQFFEPWKLSLQKCSVGSWPQLLQPFFLKPNKAATLKTTQNHWSLTTSKYLLVGGGFTHI